MNGNFASGKHALGVCDLCGVRCEYQSMREIFRAGFPTNIMACPICWDQDHPQLFLGRRPVFDPQALERPRPDTGRADSIAMFSNVKMLTPPVSVLLNGPRVSTWTAVNGTSQRYSATDYANSLVADSFVEDSSSGVHGITKIISIVPNANVSLSVNLKGGAGFRQYVALRIEDSSDSNPMYTEVFDHNNGTYLGVGSVLGGATMISRVITPLGNGWSNYSVVFNLANSVSSVRCCVYGRDLASTGYVGDGRTAFQYIDEPIAS